MITILGKCPFINNTKRFLCTNKQKGRMKDERRRDIKTCTYKKVPFSSYTCTYKKRLSRTNLIKNPQYNFIQFGQYFRVA